MTADYTFTARYEGQPNYDEEFSLEGAQCGCSVATQIGPAPIAFDIWLYDEAADETVVTFLLGAFAQQDQAIRMTLEDSGEVMPMKKRATVTMETDNFRIEGEITEVRTGQEELDVSPPKSILERLFRWENRLKLILQPGEYFTHLVAEIRVWRVT